jgi:hypothetical protein
MNTGRVLIKDLRLVWRHGAGAGWRPPGGASRRWLRMMRGVTSSSEAVGSQPAAAQGGGVISGAVASVTRIAVWRPPACHGSGSGITSSIVAPGRWRGTCRGQQVEGSEWPYNRTRPLPSLNDCPDCPPSSISSSRCHYVIA